MSFGQKQEHQIIYIPLRSCIIKAFYSGNIYSKLLCFINFAGIESFIALSTVKYILLSCLLKSKYMLQLPASTFVLMACPINPNCLLSLWCGTYNLKLNCGNLYYYVKYEKCYSNQMSFGQKQEHQIIFIPLRSCIIKIFYSGNTYSKRLCFINFTGKARSLSLEWSTKWVSIRVRSNLALKY